MAWTLVLILHVRIWCLIACHTGGSIIADWFAKRSVLRPEGAVGVRLCAEDPCKTGHTGTRPRHAGPVTVSHLYGQRGRIVRVFGRDILPTNLVLGVRQEWGAAPNTLRDVSDLPFRPSLAE